MKVRFLSGNAIKILAAALMVVDHVGMIFYPQAMWLRCIGRISFPLFAFMLAEGCRYTKNRFNHIILLSIVAVICQIAYFVAQGTLNMCIFVTFTLSSLNIFALQNFKRAAFSGAKAYDICLCAFAFIGMVFLTYVLNSITDINGIAFHIEYGFMGCMLPVAASVFDFRGIAVGDLAILDNHYIKLFCFFVWLVLLCVFSSAIQWYSLLSVIPLALYSGDRGKLKLKYFFYIFYPAHLGLLYLIAHLIA